MPSNEMAWVCIFIILLDKKSTARYCRNFQAMITPPVLWKYQEMVKK
jgi:hypothetical protein